MNIKTIAKCEINLFHKAQDYMSNPLKDFMYYLRFRGKRGQIHFSLSSGLDSLHPNLSIGENFALDSISKSLVYNSEEHLHKRIHSIQNEFTVKLIKKLPEFQTKLSLLSNEEKALVSIVKSLLSKSEYLFVVNVEEHLSAENLKIVKEAIKYECIEFKRKIMIHSLDVQNWLDLATKIIEKDHNDEYTTLDNPLSKLYEEIKEQTPHHFTLIKKVG